MGLGKTPIAIASAEELFTQDKINTCLIVCPASLKYQWAQKIAEFTDCYSFSMKLGKEEIIVPVSSFCRIIDGDKEKRLNLYEYNIHSCKYIIIGYDNVINDYSNVRKIGAEMVVLDEATAIKSFKAQRSKKIKKLFNSEYRLALTGTPIENRPDELFSIMQWVDPDVLGRYDLFEKAYIDRNKYGWVVAYKNLPTLRNKIAPAISRLTNNDLQVKELMPESEEDNWYVDFDKATLDIYKHIATDMLAELETLSPYADFSISDYYQGLDESKPSGKLMAMYSCLEMLTDHPDLIIHSGMLFERGNKKGSRYAWELWQSGMLDDILESPKMNLLYDKVIREDRQEKILIFTKFRHMLDTMQYYLPDSVQFHGGMTPIKKAEAIAKFKNGNSRFFLSSDAGSYGVDMYMARTLINYDLPWSAGKQDQRNYRHIRRSSIFDKVYIHNLICRQSFEERRVRILDRKRRVGRSILDGEGHDSFGRIEIDGDSLRDHLTQVLHAGTIVTKRER